MTERHATAMSDRDTTTMPETETNTTPAHDPAIPEDAPTAPARQEAEHLSTADIATGTGTRGGNGVDARAEADRPAPTSAATPLPADESGRAPLFEADRAADLKRRWDGVQVGFVDEPRSAVEQADSLVAEVMQGLAAAFARERSSLEGQWSKGQDVSTEDLRQTLRRYRSFFDRLLSL